MVAAAAVRATAVAKKSALAAAEPPKAAPPVQQAVLKAEHLKRAGRPTAEPLAQAAQTVAAEVEQTP